MTKTIALVLAGALVACTADPASARSMGTEQESVGDQSTVEACTGYWNCFDWGKNWMRRKDNQCVFGDGIVLNPDGSADGENSGEGRWEGDAYYMKMFFDGARAEGISCRRLSAEESKDE